MNVNELLDTIEDTLEESAGMPLSGGKRIVDVEQIRDYLDEIRQNLPVELRQAQSIVSDRAQLIESANAQAQAIVKKAEERARVLVSEAEIVKAAQQRAGEIQPGPDKAALQEAEHQGVRAQGFDDMVDDKDHLVGEAGKLGSVLLGGGTGVVQQLVAHPGQQGLRDRTLIGKIEVERALAHLGAGGDILHAGLGGAPLQKQLVSCVQKRTALFLFLSFHGAHSLLHPLF